MFLIIIGCIIGGNLLWWRWADSQARSLRPRRAWRIAAAIFAMMQLLYIALFIIAPSIARRSHTFPMPVMAVVYIWNLLILPLTLLVIVGRSIVGWMKPPRRPVAEPTVEPIVTRRQWISAAAISIPPLIAAGTAAR